MSRDEFWSMTLPELFREFAAARARRTYEASMGMYVAWHTARLMLESKGGKLPSLASQMPTVGPKKPATPREMLNVVGMLSEQYGIPLRKTRVHLVKKKKTHG